MRMEAAGCYGRNGADDVAADAALLSRAVGAPVRVQLTREQEHAWEPKGAAQLMQVDGGLNADGSVAAYDFATRYPSNGAPTLALLLTRTIEPAGAGLRDGRPHRAPAVRLREPARRGQRHGADPARLVAARRVGAAELASRTSPTSTSGRRAGVDPVDVPAAPSEGPARRRAGRSGRTRRLEPRPERQDTGAEGDILRGQGFAYARYVHSKWPGFGAAWSAWVADVEVNKATGEVSVTRVVVGHDAGLMVNPAGVAAPDPRQRDADDQPRAEGGGVVRPHVGGGARMGQLPDPQLPRGAGDRGDDAAAAGRAAAGRRRVVVGAGHGGDRQRDLRCDRRALSRAAVHAGAHPAGTARRGTGGAGSVAVAGIGAAARSRADGESIRRSGAVCSRPPRPCAPPRSASAPPCCRGAPSRRSRGPMPRSTRRDHRARPATRRARRLRGLPHRAGRRPQRRRPPLQTPFGTIYATNLTPDVETGIGAWSFPPSSARCARASRATAGTCTRRFPYTRSPRPPTTTCRRSTPT